MEKRIELERRGREISKITELNLDNCKSANVVGLSEEWVNLVNLSMISVGLTSLEGFPKLPNLEKLDLTDNRLTGGLDAISSLPKLNYLYLSGNKFKDIEALKPLKDSKSLDRLHIANCDFPESETFRDEVFNMLPHLKFLDGFDRLDNEDEEDDELNGDDEEDLDDELDEEEDEEDDDDEVEGEDIPLEALYNKSYNNDNADDEDFEAFDEEEDDDLIEEEEEEEGGKEDGEATTSSAKENNKVKDGENVRGTKRKHEEESEEK